MASTILIEDITQWDRVGGREYQFFATDAEVLGWLTGYLPPEYAPYRLVGSDLVPEGSKYVQQPFECEVPDLLACARSRPPKRHMFDLWSEALTPGLSLQRGTPINGVCAFNGLVKLDHGFLHHGRRDVSRIAVVDRIRNRATGEVLGHPGYLKVFQTLRREIKKAVCYACVRPFGDGEFETDRSGCWTEGAVREYEAGVPFVARPGRRLEGKPTTRKR